MRSTTIELDLENLRIDDYSTARGRVFSIFDGDGRHFKRVTLNDGSVSPDWVRVNADGESSPVLPEDATPLKAVYKRRTHFPRVRRFPRGKTDVLSCLAKAQGSYQTGDLRRTRYLVEEVQRAVAPLDTQQTATGPLTWYTIPRFDPTRVLKTKYVVESFIVEGNLHIFFGEPGSFKSTLLLLLAGAIAAGKPVLQLKTRRRRVLYLDYENPANVIQARCENLGLDLSCGNFIIWDRFGNQPPPRPGDPELEEIVKDCVAQTGRGPVIIFDSWSSILEPGEGGELTGQTAAKFLELRKLADMGATIVIIDHSRKYDKKILYGGKDKEAKVDSIHTLMLCEGNFSNPVVVVESWLKRHAPKHDGTFALEVRSERDQKGNWHIREVLRVENPEVEQRAKSHRTVENDHPGESTGRSGANCETCCRARACAGCRNQITES